MVSLCNNPSYPGTHFIYQIGVKLTDLYASTLKGLKVCATTPNKSLISWNSKGKKAKERHNVLDSGIPDTTNGDTNFKGE